LQAAEKTMKISRKQLEKIAEELIAGNIVYLNRKTFEFKSFAQTDLSRRQKIQIDSELKILEEEWPDFIILEKLSDSDFYKLMQAYIEESDDERLQVDLTKILKKRKPIPNFINEVENATSKILWKNFLIKKYLEYLVEQLEMEGILMEKS
jgi:hypothetical protein